MEPRLNFFNSGPEAMKAMAGLDQQITRSGLEKSLIRAPDSGWPNSDNVVVQPPGLGSR